VDSLKNRRKRRGLRAKQPFISFLSTESRGGGAGRRRRPSPAAQGTAAAGARGERERGATGSRFPSPISEEGARREGRNGHGRGGRAAAVGSASRGGQGRVLVGKREREGPGTYLDPSGGNKRGGGVGLRRW